MAITNVGVIITVSAVMGVIAVVALITAIVSASMWLKQRRQRQSSRSAAKGDAWEDGIATYKAAPDDLVQSDPAPGYFILGAQIYAVAPRSGSSAGAAESGGLVVAEGRSGPRAPPAQEPVVTVQLLCPQRAPPVKHNARASSPSPHTVDTKTHVMVLMQRLPFTDVLQLPPSGLADASNTAAVAPELLWNAYFLKGGSRLVGSSPEARCARTVRPAWLPVASAHAVDEGAFAAYTDPITLAESGVYIIHAYAVNHAHRLVGPVVELVYTVYQNAEELAWYEDAFLARAGSGAGPQAPHETSESVVRKRDVTFNVGTSQRRPRRVTSGDDDYNVEAGASGDRSRASRRGGLRGDAVPGASAAGTFRQHLPSELRRPLPPRIIPDRGEITTATPVVIQPQEGDRDGVVQIRYSVDGSRPHCLYTGPLTLCVPPGKQHERIHLQAMTVALHDGAYDNWTDASGQPTSNVAHATVTVVLSEVAVFNPNIRAPTAKLQTVGAFLYFDLTHAPPNTVVVYQLQHVSEARQEAAQCSPGLLAHSVQAAVRKYRKVRFSAKRGIVYDGQRIPIADDIAKIYAWTVDAASVVRNPAGADSSTAKWRVNLRPVEDFSDASDGDGNVDSQYLAAAAKAISDVSRTSNLPASHSHGSVALVEHMRNNLRLRSTAAVYDCSRSKISVAPISSQNLVKHPMGSESPGGHAFERDTYANSHNRMMRGVWGAGDASQSPSSADPLEAARRYLLPPPVICMTCQEAVLHFESPPFPGFILYTLNNTEPVMPNPMLAIDTLTSRKNKVPSNVRLRERHPWSPHLPVQAAGVDVTALSTHLYTPGEPILITHLEPAEAFITARVFMPVASHDCHSHRQTPYGDSSLQWRGGSDSLLGNGELTTTTTYHYGRKFSRGFFFTTSS